MKREERARKREKTEEVEDILASSVLGAEPVEVADQRQEVGGRVNTRAIRRITSVAGSERDKATYLACKQAAYLVRLHGTEKIEHFAAATSKRELRTAQRKTQTEGVEDILSTTTLAIAIEALDLGLSPPTSTSTTQPTKANSTRAERRALHKAQQAGKAPTQSKRDPAMPPPRLLIASIGNPAPYLNTLHSAAHLVLTSLSSSLGGSNWVKSRAHGNGLLSTAYVDTNDGSACVTMWQSPSLMNVSGPAVTSAWRAFLKENPVGGDEVPHLVVLHDELETALGKVRVKPGTNSPKGHNGLKSIKQSLANLQYTRIGLGIGRPLSREPDEVARYVLRKWTPQEREALLGSVGSVGDEIQKLLDRGV